MRRDLQAFSQSFDLLVIGAGIHGVCIARLAALAGLKVALVEKGDFSGATSRNSAKLLHGGLRYIQHFDVPRIRESMVAQRAWFRFAPHLVRPLRFIIPTYGYATRGPVALAGGIVAFHMIAAGRNEGIPEEIRLPPSGVMSRRSLVAAYPVLERDDVSGGAYWHDGQMLDAARLALECVWDAVDAGAVAANHAECVSLLQGKDGVEGAVVRDGLSGREFEVRAKVTVNATGPWVDWLLSSGPAAVRDIRTTRWTRNINLVTRRLYDADVAFGVSSNRASDAAIGKAKRLFFMSPWQGCTVVGTTHDVFAEHPDSVTAPDDVLDGFIAEVSAAAPGLGLKRSDVLSVHLGLTPADEGESERAKRSLLVDHEATHGVRGLLSVAGIKYTTAPVVARQTVELACRKLGRATQLPPFEQPAHGALAGLASIGRTSGQGAFDWARHVYGRRAEDCLGDLTGMSVPGDDEVFRRRVSHGIKHEMLVRLSDALLRATDVAERGLLTEAQLLWSADTLEQALGWSAQRRDAEIADARAALARLHVRLA